MLSVALTACAPAPSEPPVSSEGPKVSGSSGEARLRVVATLFPIYDFARTIGGAHAEVTLLLPPGAESHTFEPVPGDLIRLAECDLLLANGGHSEHWIDRLIDSAELEADRLVRMTDYVPMIQESETGILDPSHEHDHDHDDHDHDHEHDHDDHEHEHDHEYDHDHAHGTTDSEAIRAHNASLSHPDEHIWTSPKNAVLMAQAIAEAFVARDPVHEADYRANEAALIEELETLDRRFEALAESAPDGVMVVADRFPLIYFTTAYDIDYLAAYAGCAAEAEPTPQTVQALIDYVSEHEIRYVFHIEFSNEKLADTVCEATGATSLLFHSAHNVTQRELDQGVTYLSLMWANLERLAQAFGS